MKHILIVDDNKTNLTLAKNELSKEYQVTPVLSGFAALQFLEKRSTDLILLDINMPHLNGINAYKKMISNKLIDADNTLVIILSAIKNNKCYPGLGLNYSLTKSFRIEELQNIIDRFEISKH